ncbi:MAG: SusC/RagA family TonB-linked outer membrane protein [Bacteroidales bacterium]|nr:SusC/RagA family TonB-linked outer membrane protein [Bacteroidales bacterium]
MRKLKTILVILIAAASLTNAYGQNLVLRGRILDAGDQLPVIGANIIEFDDENRIINGTITNVNGDFVLEMRDADNIVKVSVIGYETKEIPVDGTRQLTIELVPANLEIEEVTITAAAQNDYSLTNIAERDNASSTVKVNLADMADQGISSASEALQGKVSGLDIIAASGDPGSGSTLVIRGLSSMGNSQPLIVVDGIPQQRVSSNFDLSSADTEDISELVNLALQDIKSIEILKDAASTAVYGSQGADGVLLIETYKGRMGQVQFDYQYKSSLNIQPPAIPMLDGNEYIMLQLEEWHNRSGVFTIPDEIAYNTDYKDFYNYSANTDWIGAITQNAMTHDHYFKVSGGGEKTRYFTSFSYVDEGGTTINTSSKRFSTRINLDYFLSRNLLFSIQFNYTNNRTNGNLELNRRNIREMAYIKSPNMSIWEYDSYGNPTGEYFTPITSYQGDGVSYFNPVAVAELGKDDNVRNNLQNTFRLRYRINDWLTLHEVIAFQYAGTKYENYLPYNAIGADWLAWNINKAEESNNINTSIRTESRVTFEAPFKNTNHVVTGAFSWITDQSSYEWMNIQSNRTPSTDIQDPAIDAQINWIGGGSGETRQLGALGNLNYKYKDKYMLQTTLRADAHTSFGINYRWGLFKGVSGGWRFSSEPWFENVDWLGESMIRATWGVAGRQPWDSYARFATYNSSQTGSYIESPAIVPDQIQLNNLRWESTTSTDIAIELNLFDDRIFFEAIKYNKITYDLLFYEYNIPYSSGYDNLIFFNGGELENNGWELTVDWKIIRNENWLWSVNFNTSQNVNRFNDLPENFNTEASTSIGNGSYPRRVIEGEPIGSFFGFRYLGVWANDAEVVARDPNGDVILDNEGLPVPLTYKGTYVFKGGDPIYEDRNHDGIIDLNDVVWIGDSNPDYMGGFGTSIKYRDISFSTSFHYRLGFDIVNGVAIQTEGMNNKNNQSKAVLRRWRVQTPVEDLPDDILQRAYMYHPANNLGSDRYVEPGDYLRLINFKLGYRLPNRVSEKMNIRSLSITASARKLFTFTNYSGQDPEVGQNASDPFWIGYDYAKTPPPKIITLSVNIGL